MSIHAKILIKIRKKKHKLQVKHASRYIYPSRTEKNANTEKTYFSSICFSMLVVKQDKYNKGIYNTWGNIS